MVRCTPQCDWMQDPYNVCDDFTLFTDREFMPDADKKKLEKPSGKVRHDPGGRAVWQWAIDSGRHAIESTSRLLKKLDLTSLQVLDYDEVEKQEKADRERTQNPDRPIPTFGGDSEVDPMAGNRRGFNPYDSRTPVSRSATSANPKTPSRPRLTQPVKPDKKPGILSKLFGSGKK